MVTLCARDEETSSWRGGAVEARRGPLACPVSQLARPELGFDPGSTSLPLWTVTPLPWPGALCLGEDRKQLARPVPDEAQTTLSQGRLLDDRTQVGSGVLVTGKGQRRPQRQGCSVPRVRLRLKGALSFGALGHRRGSARWNGMEQRGELAPSPAWAHRPGRRASLPGAAHLDSKEDTGFSAELLRSQGFRPASVGSRHG